VDVIRFPVEAGHVMTFARALGDPEPAHGLAPPKFVRAVAHFDPDAPRPRPGVPWRGSGREPSGDPPDLTAPPVLHAEQHYEYHRPVRAGDVLVAETEPGRTWERVNRAGRVLHFTETVTRFRDEAGEPVVTSRAVSVVVGP
jgi:hypothetical protein